MTPIHYAVGKGHMDVVKILSFGNMGEGIFKKIQLGTPPFIIR